MNDYDDNASAVLDEAARQYEEEQLGATYVPFHDTAHGMPVERGAPTGKRGEAERIQRYSKTATRLNRKLRRLMKK